jgi:hypothetical protein
MFVLIHGWYVLHEIIPDFRHGDTHEGNFMVKLERGSGIPIDGRAPVNIFYVEELTYAVPYYGVMPKVIDFDHARSDVLGIVTYTANMQLVNMYANELARLFYELARKLTKSKDRSEFSELALKLLMDLNPSGNHMENTHTLSDNFPSIKELLTSKCFDTYKISDRILSRDEIMRDHPELTIKHIYRPLEAKK